MVSKNFDPAAAPQEVKEVKFISFEAVLRQDTLGGQEQGEPYSIVDGKGAIMKQEEAFENGGGLTGTSHVLVWFSAKNLVLRLRTSSDKSQREIIAEALEAIRDNDVNDHDVNDDPKKQKSIESAWDIIIEDAKRPQAPSIAPSSK